MDIRPTGPNKSHDKPRPDPPRDPTPVGYRLRPAVGLRMVGAGCVWLCLPVALEVLRRTVPAADVVAVSVLTWVGVAVFAVIVLVGAWLLLDRRPRLLLTPEGYTNRTRLFRRRTTGRWAEVTGVHTIETAAGPVLRIEHRDGALGLVPSGVLDAELGSVEREIYGRLNDAYGYRPLS